MLHAFRIAVREGYPSSGACAHFLDPDRDRNSAVSTDSWISNIAAFRSLTRHVLDAFGSAVIIRARSV
jgi:hypothetical protein